MDAFTKISKEQKGNRYVDLAKERVFSSLSCEARPKLDRSLVYLELGLDESHGGLLEVGIVALAQGVINTRTEGLFGGKF